MIYLKQQHDKERDRIKRDLKTFNLKLQKFVYLNQQISWFGTSPPELSWKNGCHRLLDYYWNAKRGRGEWHLAFDWLVYLQLFVYDNFIKYEVSFRADNSIIEFEDWWNSFHTFSEEIEKLYMCISPGTLEEIIKKYKKDMIKNHPDWKSRQMQSILNYYEGSFHNFLLSEGNRNAIQIKIEEFKKSISNVMLESNISIACIIFFCIYINFRIDDFSLHVAACV